jgi:enterobacterial common antigen flippase
MNPNKANLSTKFTIMLHIVTTVITQSLGIVMSQVVSHVVGPKGWGSCQQILTIPTFIASLMVMGVSSALILRIKQKPSESVRYTTAALIIATAWGILLILFTSVMLPYIGKQYTPVVLHMVQIMMACLVISAIVPVVQAFNTAKNQFTRANFLRVLPGNLACVISIALALSVKITPVMYIGVFLVINIITAILCLGFHVKDNGLDISGFISTASDLTRQIGKFATMDVVNILSAQIDYLFINLVFRDEQFGNYVFGWNILQLLTIIQGGIIFVLLPKGLERSVEEMQEMVLRTMRLMMIFLFLIALPVYFLIPFLVHLRNKFVLASDVAQGLLPGIIFMMLSRLLAQIFAARGKPQDASFCQGIGLICSIPLFIYMYFVPVYGVHGVAVTMTIMYTMQFISTCVSLHKKYSISYSSFLPKKSDLKWALSFITAK